MSDFGGSELGAEIGDELQNVPVVPNIIKTINQLATIDENAVLKVGVIFEALDYARRASGDSYGSLVSILVNSSNGFALRRVDQRTGYTRGVGVYQDPNREYPIGEVAMFCYTGIMKQLNAIHKVIAKTPEKSEKVDVLIKDLWGLLLVNKDQFSTESIEDVLMQVQNYCRKNQPKP